MKTNRLSCDEDKKRIRKTSPKNAQTFSYFFSFSLIASSFSFFRIRGSLSAFCFSLSISVPSLPSQVHVFQTNFLENLAAPSHDPSHLSWQDSCSQNPS